MEHIIKGLCKYCGSPIYWDENYVRFFLVGDVPEQDIEEFGHLDCYIKTTTEFLGIDKNEKIKQWASRP